MPRGPFARQFSVYLPLDLLDEVERIASRRGSKSSADCLRHLIRRGVEVEVEVERRTASVVIELAEAELAAGTEMAMDAIDRELAEVEAREASPR